MKLKKFRPHLVSDLILIIFFAAVVFAAVAAPILANQWFKTPFIGGFLEPTLHFKKFAKINQDSLWSVHARGWGLETQLVSLDGNQVQNAQEISAVLTTKRPGEPITFTVLTEAEKQITETLTLSTFKPSDQLLYFYLPYFAGFISLIFGLWMVSHQQRQSLSIAYAVLAASLALILFTYFDFFTSHKLCSLLFLGTGTAAGALIQIAILLPRQKGIFDNKNWIQYAGYPHNLILAGLASYQLHLSLDHLPYMPILELQIVSLALSLLILICFYSILKINLESPLVAKQSETLLASALLSFLPFYIYLFVNLIYSAEPKINPLLFLPLCTISVAVGLLSRPYTLPQTRQHLYRILIYILLTFLFGIAYTLVIFVLNLILFAPLLPDNPLILGSLVFLLILVFEPIRRRVDTLLGVSPSSSEKNDLNLALEYTEQLIGVDKKEKALIILHDAIQELMRPEVINIFLYDQQKAGYIRAHPLSQKNDKQMVLPLDSDIAATLKRLRTSLYINNRGRISPTNKINRKILEDMGTPLHIPIPGSYGLLGWVSLGEKLSKESYTARDINLIETLASEFALVYERTDMINSTTHRLKEMEILNQIAVTVNNLTDFDPLLIAVFSQIRKILPIDRFSLIMEAEKKGTYQRQFLYQKDRILISTREPQSLGDDFPEKKAILQGDSILQYDDDAWLFVPLETEKRTIGALSLGSSKEKTIFDHTDLNLINSIANLVTGAIIKSRFLQESQNRTQHLSMLNEVTKQLTSTLELESLLKRIVESAIEIIKSTSCVLLIFDSQNDELVYEVTTGEIGSSLQGKRIPKDEGASGEAFIRRKPVIKNRIHPENLYLFNDAPETITKIQNILAVPLISQGEVVGILEAINKNDDLPFTADDLQILEGFASQAAVAIHNATLYTKTDQALEDRIDELYTIQRIDQELHSSQELDKALQTTLSAALAQTNASCGTIAIADTYYHNLDNIWQSAPNSDQPVSLDRIELKNFQWFTEDSLDPYQFVETSADELTECLNVDCNCKAHFRIQSRLENSQYSLLMLHLESSSQLTQQDIDFLIRLNDHASIALQNAILYEDLQDAIQAKNEFISFISHELKNPLTAIKGHADILAKGIIGRINQEQADYLRTISHNVRRMNTFITDLSDQAHIETRSLRIFLDATPVIDAVEEVLQSNAQGIKEKSLHIEQRIEDSVPDVWCDRLRLIQILSNLLSNAIKYTPKGGKITIAAEHAINTWDQEGPAEVIHFWIKDNGYGISLEDQSHLFTKFYRGTNDTILNIPGTGLGLNISKSLTEMMNGTMWFESTPGEGSTFHFTIPI